MLGLGWVLVLEGGGELVLLTGVLGKMEGLEESGILGVAVVFLSQMEQRLKEWCTK